MRLLRRIISPRPAGAIAPWEGERVDVERYWAEAWEELRLKQAEVARGFQLADARWRVIQDAGLIEFERSDGAIVRGPVQIIGSWNPKNETFTWGWDHPSVHMRLRAGAERTRWFGDAHNVIDLTARQVRESEAEAWRLTAVAAKVNAATGAYRGPTDGPVVFMTMGDLAVRAVATM